jgi:hypothetical protein
MAVMLGLNHYTSKYVADKELPTVRTCVEDDTGANVTNKDLNGTLIGAQAASPWFVICAR